MELMVPLIAKSKVPLYAQIYEFVKEEIKRGSMRAGIRLPSTRALAEYLKVSRSTIQMAFDQLLSEGYIEAVPCKGYYVAGIEGLADVGCSLAAGPGQSDTVVGGEQKEGQGYLVDFSPRGIDLNHFPFHIWRKITKETFVDNKKEMFAEGDPQGEPALREAVRGYLHSARGVNCKAGQIIVGAGSEYLFMLLHLILGSGRKIAMENPTYKQAYRIFQSLGYQVIPVKMDDYGMDIEVLMSSIADIAYIMPSHQYPTGIVMPVKRRQELLAWAAGEKGRYLIEDDYDSEFRYKGKPIPALQGMDSYDKVIYIGTFSKSVAPAIRISFMVLPESLLPVYQKKFSFYKSTVSRIDQNILYQFLVGGFFERHLNRMRTIYRLKHDLLLTVLKPLEPYFTIKGEYAGLHLLLTHKLGRTESELVSLAKEVGIRVYGLSSYFIEAEWPDTSTVVLGYANLTEEEIRSGVAMLKQAWYRDSDAGKENQ